LHKVIKVQLDVKKIVKQPVKVCHAKYNIPYRGAIQASPVLGFSKECLSTPENFVQCHILPGPWLSSSQAPGILGILSLAMPETYIYTLCEIVSI
jgi:hypothetical protein